MIVNKCLTHGDLTIEEVVKRRKRADGSQAYRCKKCLAVSHKKHYESHKETVLDYQNKYREKNPEKVAMWKKLSRQKNKEKYRIKERKRHNNYERKISEKLSDPYIKKLIVGHSGGLSKKDIPQELIDFKKAQMQLKRYINKLQGIDKRRNKI